MFTSAALAAFAVTAGLAHAQASTGFSITYDLTDPTNQPDDTDFKAFFGAILGPAPITKITIDIFHTQGSADLLSLVQLLSNAESAGGGRQSEYRSGAGLLRARISLSQLGDLETVIDDDGEIRFVLVDNDPANVPPRAGGRSDFTDSLIVSGVISEQALLDAGASPAPGESMEFLFNATTADDLFAITPDDTVPIPGPTVRAADPSGFFMNSDQFSFIYAGGGLDGEVEFVPAPAAAPLLALGAALAGRRRRHPSAGSPTTR